MMLQKRDTRNTGDKSRNDIVIAKPRTIREVQALSKYVKFCSPPLYKCPALSEGFKQEMIKSKKQPRSAI